MTRGYNGVTWGYRELKGVIRGYKRWVRKNFKGLQGGYKGL